jgi:hypothetical protein
LQPQFLAVGEFSADGKTDVAVGSGSSNNVLLFLGASAGISVTGGGTQTTV